MNHKEETCMNRIYKVIWSKVKHQYVVTSEFAHNCTKSTGSRIGRSTAAVLAAVVLTMGAGSVQAANTATGDGAQASGYHSTAYGENAKAYSANSVAVGTNARVWATDGTKDLAQRSTAIGADSQAMAENAVAVGYGSIADEKDTVSIGSKGNERRLVNLKDGTEDTDAATYKQVKDVNAKAEKAQATAEKADAKAEKAQSTAEKADAKAEKAQSTAEKADAKAEKAQSTAEKADAKAEKAQSTAEKADAKAEKAQSTAEKADAKAEKAQTTANENRDRIGWDEERGDYKKITVADQNGTKFNNLTDALNYTKDIVGDGNLTNGGSTLTEGININSAAIAQNRQDINNLNHRVDNLDSRIDKVGAGAAALAALHPLDFDPDAKWDFAAGYGNYGGENAVAVGTFYRPNEDTMFSVGGTFGNGENMINAGVSLKIGAGSSHVTTSRVAMAKEIKSMRDIVAKQDAQIQKLTAMVNALVGVQTETDSSMFPDVPENHWAYEAVEAMAKSGLVKGYPDGEFKGDRTMTRYEFAQIVYNAIQAGAEVDARLVEEFKPELQFFHIATVAKDKDGNPTIERVRAN